MGREVRRVPANWEHPRYEDGRLKGQHRPLMAGSYAKQLAAWQAAKAGWERGLVQYYEDGDFEPRPEDSKGRAFEDYADWAEPDPGDYMPDWPDEERTHWQMYENVSEGTPLSPVMDDPDRLAHWLADNEANAGAGRTASYEAWKATIERGYAFSMMYSPETGLISGVEFAGTHTTRRAYEA